MKRTPLRRQGMSESAKLKRDIQALARDIVIKRDGGCVLRSVYGVPRCGGYRNDGQMVLQADHLISRGNSATYGDTRLIVCLCKAHHGWKSVGSNLRKAEYDAVIRAKVLSPERVALWDLAEHDRFKPQPQDWKLVKIALTQELARTPAYVEPLAK